MPACSFYFFRLINTQNGALSASRPAYSSFAVSYFTPKNILNLSNLGRPRQGPFSFHRNTEAMKYEVHLPPASPIAALLILPAIYWGQNYVPVPPYALIFFSVFLFYSFWIFSFYYSLPFLLSFSISSYSSLLISSYSSLLISSYSSRRCYSSSSFSSPLIC